MPIIDINVQFGAYPARHRNAGYEQIAAEAQAMGIDLSAVCSTTGIYYNDEDGNAATLAACGASPGALVPVATINPSTTFDSEAAVQSLISGPFRLVRFFPSEQNWPIEFAPFIQCLRHLAKGDLPILISSARLGDATKIAALINTHAPQLAAVLAGVTNETAAEAVAAMRDCPGLYLETHALLSSDLLPRIRDAVGAERIVYGSGASALSLGASLYYVYGSSLSEEEKNLALGGNAAKLLKII